MYLGCTSWGIGVSMQYECQKPVFSTLCDSCTSEAGTSDPQVWLGLGPPAVKFLCKV